MKFSLLMSIYKNDRPEHFLAALESIKKNTVLPDELILVEDGPISNELKDIIEFYRADLLIKSIVLETNQGLGRALSIGINHCNYDFIARFDSDDICASDRFEKQINFLKINPNVSIVGSWIQEFENTHGEPYSIRVLPCKHEEIIKFAKRRCPFNHMSVVFKKIDVLNAGSYKNEYLYEDYALWVRMIMNGCVMANIPSVLVYARAGKEMINRRGGIKYAIAEYNAQKEFNKLGFISNVKFLQNIVCRLPVRVLPLFIRKFIYLNLLRS